MQITLMLKEVQIPPCFLLGIVGFQSGKLLLGFGINIAKGTPPLKVNMDVESFILFIKIHIRHKPGICNVKCNPKMYQCA